MDDERVYRCWNAQNPGYEMLYAVKTSKKCDRYLIDVACILSAYLPQNCIARFWYVEQFLIFIAEDSGSFLVFVMSKNGTFLKTGVYKNGIFSKNDVY